MQKVYIRSASTVKGESKQTANGYTFLSKTDAVKKAPFKDRKKKRFVRQAGILALQATKDAITKGGIDLETYAKEKVGIFLAESLCCFYPIEDNWKNIQNLIAYEGFSNQVFPDAFSRTIPFLEMMKVMPAMPVHILAAELEVQGYCKTFLSSPNAGLQALISACEEIKSNRCDLVIAGGTQSKDSPIEYKRALRTRNIPQNPDHIMGDLATMFLLEKNNNTTGVYIQNGFSFQLNENDSNAVIPFVLNKLCKNEDSQNFSFVDIVAPWEKETVDLFSKHIREKFPNAIFTNSPQHENYFSASGCYNLAQRFESMKSGEKGIIIQKGLTGNYSAIVTGKE